MKALHLLVMAFLLPSVGIPAAEKARERPKPEAFDANKNGRIDWPQEFIRYQIIVRDPKNSDIDQNGDGEWSFEEKRDWAEPFWFDVEPQAGGTSVAFAEAATTVPKEKPKPVGLGVFRLRKDHDAIVKDFDKADPASLGFYRNGLNSEDTWAVQAALGAVIPLTGVENPLVIGNYMADPLQFVPSVAIDRVTGKGGGDLKESDALSFRAGFTWGWQSTSPDSLWDYQLISLNYRAAGTTDGGDFKSAGEFEWEPLRSRPTDLLAIRGPFQPLFDAPGLGLNYRLTAAGRVEAGEAVGTNIDSFLKAGPKVGLHLQPTLVPSLTLFLEYTYLWETSGGSPDFDYLETGFRWKVDDAGQVSVEGKYRYGTLPARYTDIDLLQLSLALKF